MLEVWENEKCCGNTSYRLVVREHMSSRGIFMVKANHLPRCVKGTLRNIKNVVGNFVICTGSSYGGSVFRPIWLNMESRLKYKMEFIYNKLQ